MSLNNEQLKEWFKDEFKDIKIRLSVNEDKSSEILRRIDVIDHSTHDHRDTLYGTDGLLEQFISLKAEHHCHMEASAPGLKLAKKTLKTEHAALWVSAGAVMIAVFKDLLLKMVF
jgi:hypothetical protein